MQIRNFCIIAHIDHGKSTLADRMLELTWTVRKIDHAQMLDRMDIEQERGITIKLTPARMQRKGYEFNLIDTPGHVDFQYEVSRSLAAVEWAILLVDASQWIQAQTLSTLYQAIDQHLTIIPVLNKIDLPAANPERVAHEIENVIGIDKSEIIQISAKTWENVDTILDAIIERIQDPLAFKKSHPKKYWPTSSSSNSFSFREGELQNIVHEVYKKHHIYWEAWWFQTGFARDMRKNQTAAEEIMREVLRNRNFVWMKRRRQFPINKYIADFYCHEHKIIIEIDWGIHNTEKQKKIDNEKNRTLEHLWYKVLRFKNEDIFNDLEKVLKKIEIWNSLSEGEGQGWGKNLSRALIFDSVYDQYKGVLAYVKVVDGEIKAGEEVHLIHSENTFNPPEVGHFTPEYKADKVVKEGQIGYIVTGQKSVRDVQIWDTILWWLQGSSEKNPQLLSLVIPGFKKVKPFVYAGVYPIDTNDYDKLKDSLEKLSINDSAIEYELEDSKALGFGFRCGFLGMLHMDIVKERLSREYNMETIFTIPTVVYLIKTKNLSLDQIKSWSNIQILLKTWLYRQILTNDEFKIQNAEWGLDTQNLTLNTQNLLKPWLVVKSWSDMIDQWLIDEIREPIAAVEVVWPQEYAGNIMALCQEYRGRLINMDYIDETRVVRHYELPMGEIIIDFYDRLKSATKGYATMNYEFKKYQPADLVKLDVYINNEKVEPLSRVIHKDKSYYLWKEVVEKLKTLIPKHLFVIPLQAGIGNKMIARENIAAMRKDVIAKCYGWDVTRKRKLLAKQKEGKKKMKAIGSVNVPSDVFIKMVARGD